MSRDTYQIDTLDQLGPHLSPYRLRTTALGTFVDCLCGSSIVTVQMFVPLCSGCDAVIAGECDPCPCREA